MELTVEKMVYGGDGLARLPADEHGRGKTVFVPFVLDGERVEAAVVEEKPGFVRARAEKVLAASPQRVAPGCPYFLRCGGCHYQHSDYKHQMEIKREVLRETLRRTAKLEWAGDIEVHAAEPWRYRNRTRMRVRTHPQFAMGYYKHGSHELLAVEQCPISSPLINRAMAVVWEAGKAGKLPPSACELEFFADHADEQLLLSVFVSGEAPQEAAARAFADHLHGAMRGIAGIAFFQQRAGGPPDGGKLRTPSDDLDQSSDARPLLTLGERHLFYEAAGTRYRVDAASFFQTNRHLTDTMVRLATEGLSGGTALDLYAGVGLFSAALARSFERVIAVESSAPAVADLRKNAPANVKALEQRVEQFLAKAGAHPDAVLLDPPRAGTGERAAEALAKLGAKHVVYVSCNPATLSRDLRVLLAGGYRVESVHLLDLFPQTYHIESIFRLAC